MYIYINRCKYIYRYLYKLFRRMVISFIFTAYFLNYARKNQLTIMYSYVRYIYLHMPALMISKGDISPSTRASLRPLSWGKVSKSQSEVRTLLANSLPYFHLSLRTHACNFRSRVTNSKGV